MKQRVVGMLVLGCLAIILVPLLLDGDGIKPPPLSATIPPVPQLDTAPIAEPTRPTITADALPPPEQEANVPADTTNAKPGAQSLPPVDEKELTAAPAKKSLTGSAPDALEAAVATIMAKDKKPAADTNNSPHSDTSGLPLSYVVRLGSFTERKNADTLAKKMVDAGHKAWVRNVKAAGSATNVVYVGPVLTKTEATDLQKRVATLYKDKTVVETFSNQPLQ